MSTCCYCQRTVGQRTRYGWRSQGFHLKCHLGAVAEAHARLCRKAAANVDVTAWEEWRRAYAHAD